MAGAVIIAVAKSCLVYKLNDCFALESMVEKSYDAKCHGNIQIECTIKCCKTLSVKGL